jgi:hypothetical protein
MRTIESESVTYLPQYEGWCYIEDRIDCSLIVHWHVLTAINACGINCSTICTSCIVHECDVCLHVIIIRDDLDYTVIECSVPSSHLDPRKKAQCLLHTE